MKGFGAASATAVAIAATSLFISSAVAAVDPIVIKGSKFFYKTNGTQFFIKGVAYQQDYSGNGTDSTNTAYTDPLADATSCQRDIPYLQQLSTNTIRVYALDPTQNHDTCMNALANAGIYVIADLSAPVEGLSINRDSPSWNDQLYTRYTAVVDAMQGYTNLLGFFAGNEVANAVNNTDAAAFVKAAVRDTKAYIAAKNYRAIGVGYATSDDASIRVNIADYMDCGTSATSVDFWGYNIYSWCGNSSYTQSGYDQRTAEFATFNVPSFFAEYGCNTPSPREFTEVGALYGPQMSPVWSGGIVYMYFQEANDFGLVSVSGNTVSTLVDFENLSKQIATVTPSSVAMSAYSPTNTAAACPTENASWGAVASPLPPTPNQGLCSCMYNSLSCVVSPNANVSEYGTLFGEVCGYSGSPCAGIAANGSTGSYGAYGMCNATEQLAYAFNNYYVGQSSSASACNFGGAAVTKAATSASGTCSALMSQAGSSGLGTVTSSPTSGSGSGSSGTGSASSSKAGASGSAIPSLQSGLLPMALIVTLAGLSGAGMILL